MSDLYRRHTETRTTRTPAFWDTPTPWLPILVIHIRSQVKRKQSQSYKFLKIAKNYNFEIFQKALHATHLLKLLDKMYKYEMDPTRTVCATERTRDAGRTDGQTEWNQYTPPTTSLCGVYKNSTGNSGGLSHTWFQYLPLEQQRLKIMLCKSLSKHDRTENNYSEHQDHFQAKFCFTVAEILSNKLTHWGLNEMAELLQMTFSNVFLKKGILIQISLKFVPKGQIINKSALVQVMAWYL